MHCNMAGRARRAPPIRWPGASSTWSPSKAPLFPNFLRKISPLDDKKPKIVPFSRSSGTKAVQDALEEISQSLPADAEGLIVIVQTRSGGCWPVFHGQNSHLLWMLETAKFELLLGGDDDE